MTGVGTFWRTVRHLKPAQVLARIRFRLHKPKPDMRPAPARRALIGPWVQPAARDASLVGSGRLVFLNIERDLDACGWDDPQIEKLWRYNLHYFDDLNAIGSAERVGLQRALLDRWLRDNPPASGTGWEPYPVSLRIVNWVKWFLGGAPASDACLHSLAVQARWLSQRLEWHLLGNHLFVNAKALVFAGLYFQGAEAQQWLHTGLSIIDRQLAEQVLADGAQFERSPMYHALALEDLLDLLNIGQALAPVGSQGNVALPLSFIPLGDGRPRPALGRSVVLTRLPLWRETAGRMLYWLRCMAHPDGGISFFNDAAHGVAPGNAEIERYAAQMGVRADVPVPEGITPLVASGYVRVSRGPAVALLDATPIGPDYLPGHAHADTLSFELSLGARRVVVNGGTSCYGLSAQRLLERGTAAHSTVQVAGQDSSEVWSGFRVGRRARPGKLLVDGWAVSCSHDGYRHLPGGPVHSRRWQFEDGGLLVQDMVTPSVANTVARYHFAPGLTVRATAAGAWSVMAGDEPLAHVTVQTGQASLMPSRHAPQFGVVQGAQCLVVNLTDGQATTHWRWGTHAHSLSV